MVKIGLERINTQKGVTGKVLLDSGATGLVMSSEFARKQGFKLKKIERPIYMRNVNGTFNKEILYSKLQNMSKIYLTSIQYQIPMVIWPYLYPKLCW